MTSPMTKSRKSVNDIDVENFLADLRAEREALGATIDQVSALSGVSAPMLSKTERKLLKLSPASQRAVLAVMTSLQSLRMQDDKIPLRKRDVDWLRGKIAEMSGGKDAADIRAAREAPRAKRASAK